VTIEQARGDPGSVYDALNQPAKKDVSALAGEGRPIRYRSFHTTKNGDGVIRLAEIIQKHGRGDSDLKWFIREPLLTIGIDHRAREATGHPTGELGEQNRPAEASRHGNRYLHGKTENWPLAITFENWMTACSKW